MNSPTTLDSGLTSTGNLPIGLPDGSELLALDFTDDPNKGRVEYSYAAT